MKTIIIFAVVLLALAADVASEEEAWLPGTLTITFDFLECSTEDVDSSIIEVDVHHAYTSGATGVRFRLGLGAGVVATYLGETVYFENAAGNTQDGIFVCYGDCMTQPVLVATVRYQLVGESVECSDIRALAFPGADGPESIGCGGEIGLAATTRFILGYSLCSPCSNNITYSGTPTEGLSCMTVPVEATTWGAIKSLYE